MLSCGKDRAKNSESGSVSVHLNVYDLSSMNGYAYWLGLGVFHSGVQVHEVEYAFGAHENPTSGIFEGEPMICDGFRFRKSVLIGWTNLTPAEVRGVMAELATKYRGNSYDLVAKNCNHFCNDACIKLTANPIPNWVNRLARIGSLCHCIIPVNLNSIKVKACEVEKKKLRSRSSGGSRLSNRFSISLSNSSISSVSSPPPVEATSSRNRSPLPPSSPSTTTTTTTNT